MAATKVEMYISPTVGKGGNGLTPPITPPLHSNKRAWPEPESVPEEIWDFPSKRRKVADETTDEAETKVFDAKLQNVLLLHGIKQRYMHTTEHPVPDLKHDRELLVQVNVVGLNPIDWKAP